MQTETFNEILTALANYGFPMVISWYLLVRMERKLEILSENLEDLSAAIRNKKEG